MSEVKQKPPQFVLVSEQDAQGLLELKPDSAEARERIAAMRNGLGESAVNVVGIAVTRRDGESIPTAYVNLDPHDPGTYIRPKDEAVQKGLSYGANSDLPPVGDAYRSVLAAQAEKNSK